MIIIIFPNIMIITFVAIAKEFLQEVNKRFKSPNLFHGFVQDYAPKGKRVYYISPANSLGFMDGGIDKAYSRLMFPNVESTVKKWIHQFGKTSHLGRKYLPIGSAIIVPTGVPNKFLISAPTMLLPQNVSKTQNAYWATLASLQVLSGEYFREEDELVIPAMACGYGKMTYQQSAEQIKRAFDDCVYTSVHSKVYLREPNLEEQPNLYENSEFKEIKPEKFKKKLKNEQTE